MSRTRKSARDAGTRHETAVTAYSTGQHTIRVGQLYRDVQTSKNIRSDLGRTLRVEALEVSHEHTGRTFCRVDLTVISEKADDGTVIEPIRQTSIEAMRLTGQAYRLIQEAGDAA